MTGNDKKTIPPGKNPPGKSDKKPGAPDTDINEDGDIATPKRDFDEYEIKDEEDKRM